MKRPKKLKIGGHIITVDASNEIDGARGMAHTGENKIRIDCSMKQSQKEAALFHEIFHFLNTTLEGENELGHALVGSLAEQIYQVLSDNKMLK